MRLLNEQFLVLMRLLDEQYTQTPFYGVRRMTAWLRSKGYLTNPKRVRGLLRRVRGLLRKMGRWDCGLSIRVRK